MLIREIEKEGFIKFEGKNKNKEISKEEYDMIIHETYINNLRYGNGKVNSILKERFEQLKYRTKLVHNIKTIALVESAKLMRRYIFGSNDNFLIIEDERGLCLLYNLTDGEDNSFDFNKKLVFDENKTKIMYLYNENKDDYQEKIDIGYMDNIILYKSVKLVNIISNSQIILSDILVLSDRIGNKIYVDIINNHIYIRQKNYEIKKEAYTKEITIYTFNKKSDIKITGKIFTKLNIINILNNFIKYD